MEPTQAHATRGLRPDRFYIHSMRSDGHWRMGGSSRIQKNGPFYRIY